MDKNYKELRRSATNRMIGGVCAGIGDYINVDPTIIRLAAVLLMFWTGPGIVIAYLGMALVIPEESKAPSA